MSTLSRLFSTPKHATVHPEKNYTHFRLGDDTRDRLKKAEDKLQNLKTKGTTTVPAAKTRKDPRTPHVQELQNRARNVNIHARFHLENPIRKSSTRKKSPSKGGKSRRRKHRKTVKKGYFW